MTRLGCRARGATLALCLLASSLASGSARAQDEADDAANSTDKAQSAPTAIDTAELDALLARVTAEGASSEARKAAALEAIAAAGEDAAPALIKKISQLRRGPTGSVLAVFQMLKQQGGSIQSDSYDLLDALCKFPKTDGPGWKLTLQAVVVLRALLHVGEPEAVRAAVRYVDAHDGALRVEISRQLRKLGEPAIAGLISAKRGSQDVRKFVNRELEALGKKTIGDMVQVQSALALADILRAFGNHRDPEAVAVILSFVNSDRALVRQAAREALALYGANARWKLREAYNNLTGQTAQEGWSAEEVASALFAAYDKVRFEQANALLERGLMQQKAGKLQAAADLFDQALAQQPLLDRRGETVEGYQALADSLAKKDPQLATVYYRKALRVSEDEGVRNALTARVLYLEGKQLQAAGINDQSVFLRALELDPTFEAADQELERAEGPVQEAPAAKALRWGIAAALMLAAMAAAWLLPRRWLRLSPASPPTT